MIFYFKKLMSKLIRIFSVSFVKFQGAKIFDPKIVGQKILCLGIWWNLQRLFYIVRTLLFCHKIYKKLSSSIFKKLRTSLKIVYFLKRGLVIFFYSKKCCPWWALTNKENRKQENMAKTKILTLTKTVTMTMAMTNAYSYKLVHYTHVAYKNVQENITKTLMLTLTMTVTMTVTMTKAHSYQFVHYTHVAYKNVQEIMTKTMMMTLIMTVTMTMTMTKANSY